MHQENENNSHPPFSFCVHHHPSFTLTQKSQLAFSLPFLLPSLLLSMPSADCSNIAMTFCKHPDGEQW